MRQSNLDIDPPGWALGIALLAGTISIAGVTDFLLTSAGYATLGSLVWAVCYTGALATVWIVWLRDLKLTGPESG